VPRLGGARAVRALDDQFARPTSFASSPFTDHVYVTSLNGPVSVLNPQP
jgi:hypothetical protein